MRGKTLDVICVHYKDGHVEPVRVRIKDEDGLYQAFDIKEFRDLSHNGTRDMPDGVSVSNNTLIFECIIHVFGKERQIRLYNDPPNLAWRYTG